jgi:hypothetical protein
MVAQEALAETQRVLTAVRPIHQAFGKRLNADVLCAADRLIWKRFQFAIGTIAHIKYLTYFCRSP